MHLHVFSRFYKRKQIADFLFASLDYKALPICLTLKKKDFAPKGSSLYLKSWSPPRMKTHGVHIKLRETILLPLKLYLFTLSFQSKSPTELWMFLLCSNFYKEENVCSNNLSFEFFPFHFCYVLWTTFPGNIVVHVVHKWHDGLKNKNKYLVSTLQFSGSLCLVHRTEKNQKPECPCVERLLQKIMVIKKHKQVLLNLYLWITMRELELALTSKFCNKPFCSFWTVLHVLFLDLFTLAFNVKFQRPCVISLGGARGQ